MGFSSNVLLDKELLKKGFANKKNLSKEVHQQYIKPFPNKSSRIPLLNLAKALVGSSDWYQKQWEQLDALSDKEWLILWGTKVWILDQNSCSLQIFE